MNKLVTINDHITRIHFRENLVSQSYDLGYKKVIIKDKDDLINKLKTQLEKRNCASYSESKQVLNHLSKGNIYENSKTLRDRIFIIKIMEKPVMLS